MLEKTLTQKLEAGAIQDAPECLTFADELQWLSQASDPEPLEDDEESVEGKDVPQSDAAQTEKSEVSSTPAVPKYAVTAIPKALKPIEIEDAPFTALEAVLAIVASGLRTAPTNIDISQSVKFLAKGEYFPTHSI